MTSRAGLRLTLLVMAIGLATTPAGAQQDANRAVVAEVRRVLARDYVLPEKRAALDAVLARGLATGRYDGIDQRAFAERVTADMVAVAHDGHLGLRFAPDEAATMPTPRDDDASAPDPHMEEMARRTNHGVTELRVLDGNVRYMNYRGFFWSDRDWRTSAAAVDTAMAFLRGGDAIIIDLRENGGGAPEAVRHLASYFVAPGTKLMTFHLRSNAPTTSYTEGQVPGGRITGKPVYVLTSRRTFSAAEEFASHVHRFGFGTLVGATTGGGAYRNELYPVQGQYMLSVSIGRSELPGGGDWEGRGVAPTIAVAPALALDAAQAAALRVIASRSSATDRAITARLATYFQARADGVAPARPLEDHVGHYGNRVVAVDGKTLTIQREQGPVSALVPIGPNRFAMESDPKTQVRFVGDGPIVGLEIDRGDGRAETLNRIDR